MNQTIDPEMYTRDDIFANINRERTLQEELLGAAFDAERTINDWAMYINAHLVEASRAQTNAGMRKQLIKVAALAVAALETDIAVGIMPRYYDTSGE